MKCVTQIYKKCLMKTIKHISHVPVQMSSIQHGYRLHQTIKCLDRTGCRGRDGYFIRFLITELNLSCIQSIAFEILCLMLG